MVLTYNIEELGFDPDALRARYRAERDKRLRPDGIQQLSSRRVTSPATPGYFNQEGKPRGGHSLLAGQYGEGSVAFFALLRQWREEGRLAGLVIR